MKFLKNKTLWVWGAIAIAAASMIISYSAMQTRANERDGNITSTKSDSEILDDIFTSTNSLYADLKIAQDSNVTDYSLFLDLKNPDITNATMQNVSKIVESKRLSESKLEYYILDTTTQESIKRGKITDEDQALTYAWYFSFTFDDNGVMKVNEYSNKKNTYDHIQRYLNLQWSMFSGITNVNNNQSANIEILPIKNTTFVFALTDEQADLIFTQTYNYDTYHLQQEVVKQAFITLVILVAVILFIKRKGDEVIGLRYFHKIPLEFLIFAALCSIPFLIETSRIVEFTLEQTHIFIFTVASDSLLDNLILYVFENGLYWSTFFGFYAYLTMYLRDCITDKSLSTHIITVCFYRYLKRSYRTFCNFIKSFDMSSQDNRRLAVALGINFVAMFIFIAFWGFGIFFLIIYSLFLYAFGQRYIARIHSDYATFCKETKRIAKGELDHEITTDLGIFNPVRKELQDIQTGFRQAVEEEVHSQRMKTELITNVSHDLKTPLTSIISYIDLLKKEDCSEADRKKYLDTLDRNSIRLKHLIEDLFDVSKANSGNIELDRMDINICSLMKQIQVELDDKFKARKLHLRNTFSDEKVMCYLDSQKTYRIFENLLSNIAKYAMKGSRVYIDISDYGNCVEVSLRNISAVEMKFDAEDILERFSRGDSSRNSEGSGLGLAIAKSFTELHEGHLKVTLDGDLFKVTLRFPKKDVEGSEA